MLFSWELTVRWECEKWSFLLSCNLFVSFFFLPSAEYFKSSMKRLPMFQITSTSLNILGSIHRKGAGNSHMRTEWILLKDALLHNTNTQTWINPRGPQQQDTVKMWSLSSRESNTQTPASCGWSVVTRPGRPRPCDPIRMRGEKKEQIVTLLIF